jgi:TonB family protein
VCETIRSAADAGLKSLPRRGAEIGGLLITSSTSDEIVDDAALVVSEHRYGPGYHLSPRDLTGLRGIAAQVRESGGKRVIGLFRSSTGDQFTFSPNDLDVLRDELPECRLLVIVKPFADGHAIARVYQLRDGTWGQSSEFEIRCTKVAPLPERRLVRPVASIILRAPAQRPAAKKRRGIPAFWIYCVLGSLALIAAIAFLGPRPKAGAALGISVDPVGSLLRVTWNRNSPAVRSGASGALRIDDGHNHRDIPLNPGQLSNGSVMYRPDSRDVTFRLVVDGSPRAEETVRVVSGAAPLPVVSDTPSANPPPDLTKVPANVPANVPAIVPAVGQAKNGVQQSEPKPFRKVERTAGNIELEPDRRSGGGSGETTVPDRVQPATPREQPRSEPPHDEAVPAAAVTTPPPQPTATQPTPWEPLKSVMHYFDDPAVTRPAPTREVSPKVRGEMPSQPVQIRVLVAVDAHGGVAGAQALDPPASIDPELVNEALAAARHWKFEPARDHGRKIPATYTITFRFPPDNP